ncbi:NAD(P)-dependent oxidoreductase [Autumnicola psychrophila]|uniref:NAD(P)-dependent oxidoreductase n=1 Tax=Autumnicola psychrophila TaxID=3075592 RepID=A0ABU3DV82_9FLAO|nr:NAD(P)-dependent oxidoreductase [Zunongwangia sp. F225]MDT0687615.1 NAD(P)-dependent oxidoreductase [Zunongwangia sp. F225]
MKFKKIVCVDHTKIQDWALEELQQYSEEKIDVYKDEPASETEVLERIGDAEAIFVSWRTQIDEKIIEKCPNLKYIGMCCSLYDDASANVAVNFARERGIGVTGIRDYGDPGVIEFIVSELVRLLHGFGKNQWREMPMELTGRKLGIIGLGTTGQLLAKCLLPFGMDLYYFSRTRKKDWEEKGVNYLELDELLKTSEMISIHLPKNIQILKKKEFEQLGSGKILINTSLGLPLDEKAFQKWISEPSNFAIFDGDAKSKLDGRILKNKNLITVDKSAGWSTKTEERLSQKVLNNFKEFIKD